MMFSLADIAAATGGTIVSGGDSVSGVTGVSTDSRTVKPGELFVPLRGERFDGHDFILSVASAGITAVLADRAWLDSHELPANIACVAVPDTLRALGDLAAFRRRQYDIPIVGVTGSNGKTTTKEMLASILSVTGPGLKTSGNLNNLIGLPQMVFQLTEEHRWAVLEMGMSEFGEIDRLAEIAAPGVGIVTNAFPAHLETMGSVEGVARAKGELFLRLPAGGHAVLNADDPRISKLPVAAGVKPTSFGLDSGDVRGTDLRPLGPQGQEFTLHLRDEQTRITLSACGRHNVYNALAAAVAAWRLGLSIGTIRRGLEDFRPYDKRFKPEEIDGIVLVDDSYNANPASVQAALVTLREITADGRPIAVLGDMLELGEISQDAHREVGRQAAANVARLYVMGEMAGTVAEGAISAGLKSSEVLVAGSHAEIVADLLKTVRPGDTILVKGSRGMRMETVAQELRKSLPSGKGTTA